MLLFQGEKDPILGKIAFRRSILIEFDDPTKPETTERKRWTGTATARLETPTADLLFCVLVGIVANGTKDFFPIAEQFSAADAFRGINQTRNLGE